MQELAEAQNQCQSHLRLEQQRLLLKTQGEVRKMREEVLEEILKEIKKSNQLLAKLLGIIENK